MTRSILAVLILGAISTTSAQSTAADTLAQRIGIAWQPRTRSACVVLPDTAATGMDLTLLWPPANQVGGPRMTLIHAKVGERIEDCGLAEPPGQRSYRLDSKLETYVPYLAILGKVGAAVSKRAYVEINLVRDARPESVKACMSMEGVHFTVWSARPLQSSLLFHTYVPLGYDVEPNCSESETNDPKS